MTTVVYHSADYDGIFCREIAKRFLGSDVVFYGWTFGDPRIPFPKEGIVYVMDLPCDQPFVPQEDWVDQKARTVWIDHHKSSIESTPADVPGYRIDGVAACRLAYQWFTTEQEVSLPGKQAYIDRKVTEPYAVRLAGEYDIWDKRDPNADTLQYGLSLHGSDNILWDKIVSFVDDGWTRQYLEDGEVCQKYQKRVDKSVVTSRSFVVEFEGLNFLALNTAKGNSLTFDAVDKPEYGHDALMVFYYNGKEWITSMYHAKHNTGIDLSLIAKKMGGGGHRGACGFQCKELPFLAREEKMQDMVTN